jgi:hypothetical protein
MFTQAHVSKSIGEEFALPPCKCKPNTIYITISVMDLVVFKQIIYTYVHDFFTLPIYTLLTLRLTTFVR